MVKKTALVICGATIITIGAKIQIPFWPVPMTLHTLAVLTLAVAVGPRLGLAAMATYLAAGLAGLPVFSGSPERGIGFAYAMGPTGGYLIGYLLASWLTPTLAAKGNLLRTSAAMLSGLAVTYICGLLWLTAFVPATNLLSIGLTPFLLGDLLKVALGVALLYGFKNLAKVTNP
ncbi:biotin transporter BioY [Paenochrobactrum sp. BZR 588]|uniref:biotin transporter BioY n=1 Tax=Paenochrobactrum TaxID=999488 RepID=UPI0035BC2486